MIDRHLRAPAPLCAVGRLLVPAENGLIAVDAYNGTEMWHLDLPGSQRYGMPYDAGYMGTDGTKVFIAVEDTCQVVDAESGRICEMLPLPTLIGDAPAHWGYAALVDGRLYGSFQKVGASRTRPSRALIESDYANNQPLVTSIGVFCVDPDTGSDAWRLDRSGHGCGTMSGAGSCLFFRADVPTLMDMTSDLDNDQRTRTLPPTRPGCWINIIPAGGLVLIPEASASCVCDYPIQASTAYLPR